MLNTISVKLSDLNRRQRIELILTTTSTRHIDALEREFIGQVHVLPLLRNTLFEAARQQAIYRGQLTPDNDQLLRKPLSERDAVAYHLLRVSTLINRMMTTTDPRVIDEIEERVIDRLASLLTFRKALFAVARQRAQSQAEQLRQARSPSNAA